MSHRIRITLTDAQHARLLDEARRSGHPLAELVRRAIEQRYAGVPDADLISALDDSFGSWRGRAFDGEAYVEALRRGVTALPDFAAEARRQSLAVAQSSMADDDQDFIDGVSDYASG